MKTLILKIILVVVFIFGIGYVLPFTSWAENQINVQESEINVEVTPSTPQPYQDVTINITSYATDINKAMITWQSGSNIVLSGYGKTSYSFKALGPDTISIFDIKIVPPGSMSISKRVVINPSEVILMWEAVDGYTPPFYRGKSFVSKEGMIKVVAIPNTKVITSGKGNVVYTWKKDGETTLSASGYNKDAFVFKNSILKDRENVSVSVSSVNSQYNSAGDIVVPIISPMVLFYKKSPSDGVLYNNAIVNNTSISQGETTLVAEPYFLASKNKEGSFTYTWKINGDRIATPSKKTELTVRPTSEGGYANIEFFMDSINGLFQNVAGRVKLNL